MTGTSSNSTFHERLSNVRSRIISAAELAGRDPNGVTIIAVSKTFGTGAVEPALAAGHRVFGENRVQEAAEKWPSWRERHSDLDLRLIGPLQTNKVRQAFQVFDRIDTLDRPKLAHAIAKEAERSGHSPKLTVQVNVGQEPQKAGVTPAEVDDIIRLSRDTLGLPITGLMCIPPKDAPPAPFFALLAKLAARNGLAELNMGMSGDFEEAVALGATHIRLGEALFGPRG